MSDRLRLSTIDPSAQIGPDQGTLGSRSIGLYLASLVLVALGLGCASGGGGSSESAPRTDAVSERPSSAHEPTPGVAPEFLHEKVLSIRFGTGGHPIPVVELGSEDALTLEFETSEDVSETYRIRFTPASRDWVPSTAPEPNPLPRPDEILDYEQFTSFAIPYVRYTYVFPNPRVVFHRSGNYLVDVVDPYEETILFRRRFCVSDAEISLRVRPSPLSDLAVPDAIKPEIRVDLPASPSFEPEDCSVCVIKNGWADQIQCLTDFRTEGPTYVFTAEEPFRPTVVVLQKDLRDAGSLARIDDFTIPDTHILFPDSHRSTESFRLSTPISQGNPLAGEELVPYVFAKFNLLGASRSEDGPYVVGPFSGWKMDPRYRMSWDTASRTHVLDATLRKEEIHYAYLWEDFEANVARDKFEGPESVLYTVFVYASDNRYPTDRLLTVQGEALSR